MISRSNSLLLVSLLVTTLFVATCSKEKGIVLGKPIPAGGPVVKLSEITARPDLFNGKTVVIKGVISGQCPSLCEFFLTEGVHRVTIFPQGYSFPKLPVGSPVAVLAEVTAGSENIVLSALGIATQQGKK